MSLPMSSMNAWAPLPLPVQAFSLAVVRCCFSEGARGGARGGGRRKEKEEERSHMWDHFDGPTRA